MTDGWWDAQGAGEPGTVASARVDAMAAGLRRQSEHLGDIRRHALSVTLLPWESPAGANFKVYLTERCAELSLTIELLDSAARRLDDYGRLIRDAELLQHQAGL